MRKTSIFSREYEKKLRRKRFFIVSLVLIVLFLIVIYIINFSKINNYFKNAYYSLITREMSSNKDDLLKETDNNKVNISKDLDNYVPSDLQDQNDQIKDVESNANELIHKVMLNNDNEVNIVYINNHDVFEFIGIAPDNVERYSFDISLNKDKIILEDNITQDTYMLDKDFNLFKLDPEFFYSNSAGSRFYKNDIMNRYEGYNWYKDAKFLDDNTIIYISNLPWFGSGDQYIWKTDISDTNNIRHFMTSIGGQNIELGELTQEGVRVNINNEMKLLTFSFVLI